MTKETGIKLGAKQLSLACRMLSPILKSCRSTPGYHSILFARAGSAVALSAFDGASALTINFTWDGAEPPEKVVPFRVAAETFCDWAQKLPDGEEMEITPQRGKVLVANGDKSIRAAFLRVEADMTVSPPLEEERVFAGVPASRLAAALAACARCREVDIAPTPLSHLAIAVPSTHDLKLVATDGRRLGVSTIRLDPEADDDFKLYSGPQILVPRTGFSALRRILASDVCAHAKVYLSRLGSVGFLFCIDTTAFQARLFSPAVAMKFPSYEPVIPRAEDMAGAATVEADLLRSVLHRVECFPNTLSGALDIECTPDGLRLGAADAEHGESTEVIPTITTFPEPMRRTINIQFLIDAVATMDSHVSLAFPAAQEKPIHFSAQLSSTAESDTFDCYIMGMRR